MRILLAAVLTMGFGTGCSNASDTTNSSLNAAPAPQYVASDSGDFSVIYSFQRVYVVSNKVVTQKRLAVGQSPQALNAVASESFATAFASPVVSLANGQKVFVAVTISGGAEEVFSLEAKASDGSIVLIRAEVQEGAFPTTPIVDGNQVDQEAFLVVFNQWRTQKGLSPVVLSHKLTVDAAKNNKLQLQNGLGHFFLGQALGQNSAWNYPDIAAVMHGWETSSGHYANMIGAWTCMGIHKQGPYWTQNFAKGASCD